MEKIEQCPVCGSKQFQNFLKTRDFFLTREEFTIQKCSQCGFLLTNPRPETDKIGNYYNSPDYISHSDNNKNLFDVVYKTVRKYTHHRKYLLVKKNTDGNAILDIGCATGEFLNEFKKRGWTTQGVEPSKKAQYFARENYGIEVNDECAVDDFPTNSFDVITMWHVLEHVANLQERILQIKRILKKNGILIIAVPNSNAPDAKIYENYWAAYDVPRHLYHFSKSSIRALFKKYNFEIQEVLPMRLDAFYVSILSEKYKRGKNNYLKAILNGLRSNCQARRGNNYSSLIFVIKNKN